MRRTVNVKVSATTLTAALAIAAALTAGGFTKAGEVTAVPGPSDQGGMIMPMISITGFDDLQNPTSGAIAVMFSPTTPELRTLQEWTPGDWFTTTAPWRQDIGSPAGVGGTPAGNAGNGDRFNNQYGLVFSNNGGTRPNVPAGKSLGIKLTSVSSPSLESFNYSSTAPRWDRVFANVGDQVLWNGSMWHNYFTLPASATDATVTASFEIFIADTPFTGTTGFAQYDSTATTALADPNFTPASLTYTWTVSPVPEPATIGLAAIAGLAALPFLRRRSKRA
jgi:MYXO-CTERM domain-containing protein